VNKSGSGSESKPKRSFSANKPASPSKPTSPWGNR
jgi:hypothetical protein